MAVVLMFGFLGLVQAQVTTARIHSIQTANDLAVGLRAVEATTPVPATDVPPIGTFYSAKNPNLPPVPGNIFGLDAWDLGGGCFLLDDLDLGDTIAGVGIRAMAMNVPMPGNGGDGGTNSSFTSNYTPPDYGMNLWLEITGVSTGAAWFNLHNATNQVYAIWGATNLLTGWNVAAEVWPTNADVMPFTVLTLDQPSLFLRAEDWTRVTENGNTTPDWWFWEYFGTVTLSDTNLDSTGNTLLDDYLNGFDPNVIQFSLQFTNYYVNTGIAYGTITVLGGVPSYEAVLVNDVNFAYANWQPYSPALVVPLNSGDGNYDVWVGLRGLPSDAQQTWQWTQLTGC
jgi:hypothetical protein